MKIWEIDRALALHEVADLPDDAEMIRCPEQSIDTVLHRNLSIIASDFFSTEAQFLFNSVEYWGAFDFVFQLASGTVVCFENKAHSVNRKGYEKFLRDIAELESKGSTYVEMRFNHVVEHFQRHMTSALRMFAGFSLGIRSETESLSRDLITEYQETLGINSNDFADLFDSGNGWLNPFERSISLNEYLGNKLCGSLGEELVHVFFVPESCVSRVSKLQEDMDRPPANASLGSYEFYSCNGVYPTHLTTLAPVPFS